MRNEEDTIEEVEEQDDEQPELVNYVATDDIDLDDYSENISAAQVDRLVRPRKTLNKPEISHLPNGIGKDGYPIFVPGDRIVIERYASFLHGNPYLDTRTYRVQKVDHITGKVHLWDEALDQYALDNWKHGVSIGQQYRLSLGRLVSSKKRRGRPRKEQTHEEVTQPTEKKKRGRPPGVKNKQKDDA